ncbi:MAG: Fe-S cluster assembly protein SufD [Prevotellaceae bacterium]|nr:Fe-S cluster assembly protein SufD [Prevotellaceae bacterium]
MNLEKEFFEFYQKYHEEIKCNAAALTNAVRDAEFLRFSALGFPSHHNENYKYTELEKPFSFNYGLNIKRLKAQIDASAIFRCNVNGIGSHNFLVLNDDFVENPAPAKFPKGVIMGSLRTAAERYPELLAPYYNKLAHAKDDGLVAFNTAFAQDGFFMYVPDNVVLEKPVQLVNMMRANVDLMANSRNLILLGKNAKAQLLVCEHTAENVNYFANRVTEIFVAENAHLEYYVLENSGTKHSNFSSVLVEQNANSKLLTNLITLHNGITHNNIDIALNGENAETLLCGMVTCDKNQATNNSTAIYHNKANCQSTELFKYILDDNSRCGFAGKIFVDKNAQKTIALQTNKNILLTENARMRTKPQLEIYADDVKCSHGATIGQLDEQAMFYMQQRGISKSEARLMLMYAFAADILDNVHIEPLRDRLKMMVENRLRNGESKAGTCGICL